MLHVGIVSYSMIPEPFRCLACVGLWYFQEVAHFDHLISHVFPSIIVENFFSGLGLVVFEFALGEKGACECFASFQYSLVLKFGKHWTQGQGEVEAGSVKIVKVLC